MRSARSGAQPEMSLERAMDDHQLMDQIYGSLRSPNPESRIPAL
jgi:hypothetical protein